MPRPTAIRITAPRREPRGLSLVTSAGRAGVRIWRKGASRGWTLRRELLDRTLILNERHLALVLRE
jgi:hypothetical protein